VGEIADMMLDGTMCQGCGVWLHDGKDGPGYPGFCHSCQPPNHKSAPNYSAPKVNCPKCGKRVKAIGLKDHQRDAHGVKPEEPPSFSPNFDERNGIK
jgi:hypothetical protein